MKSAGPNNNAYLIQLIGVYLYAYIMTLSVAIWRNRDTNFTVFPGIWVAIVIRSPVLQLFPRTRSSLLVVYHGPYVSSLTKITSGPGILHTKSNPNEKHVSVTHLVQFNIRMYSTVHRSIKIRPRKIQKARRDVLFVGMVVKCVGYTVWHRQTTVWTCRDYLFCWKSCLV